MIEIFAILRPVHPLFHHLARISHSLSHNPDFAQDAGRKPGVGSSSRLSSCGRACVGAEMLRGEGDF